MTFQHTNGSIFIKTIPCASRYCHRNINSNISTNNIFGIDISHLRLLFKLHASNSDKLDEIASGEFTFRDLLTDGQSPTISDILYNLFIDLSKNMLGFQN